MAVISSFDRGATGAGVISVKRAIRSCIVSFGFGIPRGITYRRRCVGRKCPPIVGAVGANERPNDPGLAIGAAGAPAAGIIGA